MGIQQRVVFNPYPGAVTRVSAPFTCAAKPTIQDLAKELMSAPSNMASVIIGGEIYTVETAANIDNGICNPV